MNNTAIPENHKLAIKAGASIGFVKHGSEINNKYRLDVSSLDEGFVFCVYGTPENSPNWFWLVDSFSCIDNATDEAIKIINSVQRWKDMFHAILSQKTMHI